MLNQVIIVGQVIGSEKDSANYIAQIRVDDGVEQKGEVVPVLVPESTWKQFEEMTDRNTVGSTIGIKGRISIVNGAVEIHSQKITFIGSGLKID